MQFMGKMEDPSFLLEMAIDDPGGVSHVLVVLAEGIVLVTNEKAEDQRCRLVWFGSYGNHGQEPFGYI